MKNKLLGVGIALAMTGCGEEAPAPAPSAPPVEQKTVEQVHQDATKATLEQSNEEQKELKEFLEAAKARDPNIVDAYYSVDAEGNKIINLVRNADPSANPADKAAEGEKKEEDEGLGMLETVGLAMAGGLVGSMLANALVPNKPSPDYYQNNSAYYQRQTPEEAQRYRSSAVANYNNHSMNSNMQSSRIGKSSVPSSSQSGLTTSKPAFQNTSTSSSSPSSSSAFGKRTSSYSGKSSGS